MNFFEILHKLNGWHRLWLVFCGTTFSLLMLESGRTPGKGWLYTCVFVYTFGTGIAWVRRGFKKTQKQSLN